MMTPPRAGSPTTTSRLLRLWYENGDWQYCMLVFSWKLRSEFHFNRLLFRASPRQILDVVKSDVNHETDQQDGATGLDRANDTCADRFAPNSFDDGEHNVATIQDGDGQHIQQGEVDVHEYAEPKRQAPALFAGKQPGINIHDFHRPTQVLHFDIGVSCKQGAESIKHGID